MRENSEFQPFRLCFKIDLVSQQFRAGVFVNTHILVSKVNLATVVESDQKALSYREIVGLAGLFNLGKTTILEERKL